MGRLCVSAFSRAIDGASEPNHRCWFGKEQPCRLDQVARDTKIEQPSCATRWNLRQLPQAESLGTILGLPSRSKKVRPAKAVKIPGGRSPTRPRRSAKACQRGSKGEIVSAREEYLSQDERQAAPPARKQESFASGSPPPIPGKGPRPKRAEPASSSKSRKNLF